IRRCPSRGEESRAGSGRDTPGSVREERPCRRESRVRRFESGFSRDLLRRRAGILAPGRRTKGTGETGYSSSRRAASSSRRLVLSIDGYASLSFSSSATIAAATTSRVNHLWSAGTTYHGAQGVLVAAIASW